MAKSSPYTSKIRGQCSWLTRRRGEYDVLVLFTAMSLEPMASESLKGRHTSKSRQDAVRSLWALARNAPGAPRTARRNKIWWSQLPGTETTKAQVQALSLNLVITSYGDQSKRRSHTGSTFLCEKGEIFAKTYLFNSFWPLHARSELPVFST